ncbi:MAG: SNF2-related protein, partial [Terriglobales bacterium]
MGRYVFQSPEPFQHQVEGVRQLIAKDGRLALLWSPGCGKSRTVLDYAGTLAVGANTECRVLVVAPKCTQDSWLKEAITYVPPQVGLWARVLQGTLAQKVAQMVDLGPSWAGAAHKVSPRDLLAVGAEGERNKRSAEPGEILDRSRIGDTRITLAVINLEAFSQRQQVGSQTIADRLKNAVLSFSPHILVIDECHRLKSASGNASRLLRRIAPHIKRVILLTGTPSPHSPLDIWAQWAILDPTAFKSTVTGKPLSFQGFKDRYAETGGFMGKQVVEFRHLDELQDRIAPRSMV